MEFFSIETKDELVANILVNGNSGPKPNGSWSCNGTNEGLKLKNTKLGKALRKIFR